MNITLMTTIIVMLSVSGDNIIKENLGEFTYKDGVCGPVTDEYLSTNIKLLNVCRAIYTRKTNNYNSQSTNIYLKYYNSNVEIKNQLLFNLMEEWGLDNVRILKNNIVLRESGEFYTQQYYWANNTIIIHIGGLKAKVPDEIINAYLNKYPPTISFTNSDLDAESIMRTYMQREIEMIIYQEKLRMEKSPSSFMAAAIQCSLEMSIRCKLGMLENNLVNCPASLTEDQTKRIKMYEELKNKIEPGQLVQKNIYYKRPSEPQCPSPPDNDEKLMKMFRK